MNDAQRRLIAAYYDGELGPEGEWSAQELLRNSHDARDYLASLQNLDHTLHAAFDPIARQPVPRHLHAVAARTRPAWHRQVIPAALAASLTAVAVLSLTLEHADDRMQDQRAQLQGQIEQLRHRTLENVPSGSSASWAKPDGKVRVAVTPVGTYRTPDNRFCRQYEERIEDAHGVETRYGIACRTGKSVWSDRNPAVQQGGADQRNRANVF